MALAFDERGLLANRQERPLTTTLDPSRAQEVLVDRGKLPVPHAGGYQVRLAIRDRASGHLGSAGQFVDVQDAAGGAFALSGIFLAKGTRCARSGSNW